MARASDGIALEFEGQAAAVFGAGGQPEARRDLVADADAGGVALVLGIGEMSGELGERADCVVAEEKASGHRKPGVAYDVGIAQKAGEAVPVRNFDFGFGAVDDGFAESYGEADGGAEDLIVIGVIVDVAAEVAGVEAKLAGKSLAGPELKVIAVRRFDWQAQDVGIERDDLRRTGKKNVLERRRLKNAVVRSVNDQIGRGKETGDGKARADGVLIDEELIVVPAEAGVDGPVSIGGLGPGRKRTARDRGERLRWEDFRGRRR